MGIITFYQIKTFNKLVNSTFYSNFDQTSIIEGMKLYTSKDFMIDKDENNICSLLFKNESDSNDYNVKCSFDLSKGFLDIISDEVVYNLHTFCTYTYIYIKNKRINNVDDIFPAYRFYSTQTKDFPFYFLNVNAYCEYLQNNYTNQRFIDFLQAGISRDFSSMGDVRCNALIASFFNLNISYDIEEYHDLIRSLLIRFGKSSKLIFVDSILEFLFKNMNINRANIFYTHLNDFINKYSLTNDTKINLEFYRNRLDYEFIDKQRGLNNLVKATSVCNKSKEYLKDKISPDENEIFIEAFLNRKDYSVSDLNLLSKHNEWSFDVKMRIISSILKNSFDSNTYLTVKREVVDKILTLKEFILILRGLESCLDKNYQLYEYIVHDVLDVCLCCSYLAIDGYREINAFYNILKQDHILTLTQITYGIEKLKFDDIQFQTLIDYFAKIPNCENYVYVIKYLFEIKKPRYYYYYYYRKELNIAKQLQDKLRYFIKVSSSDLDKEIGFKNILDSKVTCDKDGFWYKYVSNLKLDTRVGIRPNCVRYIFGPTDNPIFSICLKENTYSYIDDDYLIEYNLYNACIEVIKEQYLNNNLLKTIEEKIDELERLKQLEEINELKTKSKQMMERLVGIVSKNDKLASYDKVDIEPHLCFLDSNYDNVNVCYFRVGTNKYYNVKDYQLFINSVKENLDMSYGKSFTFNHNVESFNERSKNLLNLLIYNRVLFNCHSDTRFFKATDALIDYIYENYSEIKYRETLNLSTDEKVIPISKEVIDVYPFLSKDYNLNCYYDSLHTKKVEGRVISLYNNDYLISDKFSKLNFNSKNRAFNAYIINKNGINIEYVKKDFRSQIYARLLDEIQIDEEIQKEFALKELSIKVYFDYIDGIITYKDEYYVGKKLVTIDEINKEISLYSKLGIYNKLIENFGFVDKEIKDLKSIYSFLHCDLTKLKELAEVYLSDTLTNAKTKKYKNLRAYISYESGLMNVIFEESSFSNEELYQIMNTLKKKERYVRLKNDTIVEIDDESIKQLELINDLDLDMHKLNDSQSVPLYQSLKLLNEPDYSSVKVADEIKSMLNEIANFKNADYYLDEKFKKVMRDYQVDAFKWIKTLAKYNFSGILADDMGLGKSLEIISIITSDESVMPSLIVCPKSLVYNWQDEFNKWASDIDVYPIIGNQTERFNQMKVFNQNKKQVYVISYDSLKNDLELFNKYKFRYLILDEAQFIKNHKTIKAQSVKKINSELRFALTGTPIENSVIDLWSIFDFLMPKYLFNYQTFKNKYERNVVGKDEDTISRLVKKVTPFILRRTKEEVLKDLPEKIESIRVVQMTLPQRKIYEAKLLNTRDTVKFGDKIAILAALTILREICVDPSLVTNDYDGGSGKIEALSEVVEQYIDNHKIIIFSQFTSIFPNIKMMLEEKGIKYDVITGETKAIDRLNIAKDFNTLPDTKVLLISLKAGGTGLNLVGGDVVVHLDPWWNVAAENQASDRAHRIGQTNVVQVIKIICKNSIEQKVIDLQNMKKDLVDKLISKDDSNIQKLSEEDLQYLLN